MLFDVEHQHESENTAVSSPVNHVVNDDEELSQPVELAQTQPHLFP